YSQEGGRVSRPARESWERYVDWLSPPALIEGCAAPPVPPSERQGGHDYGNHDNEHNRRRIDQEKSLRRSDRPLRIQYAGRLTGGEKNCGADCRPAEQA